MNDQSPLEARRSSVLRCRKPNARGILNRLPARLKAAIYKYAETRTLPETCAWLEQKHQVKITQSPLGKWLYAGRVTKQLEKNESAVCALMERMQASPIGFSADEVQQAGQIFFSEMALQREDPRFWSITQRLNLQLDRLQLEQSRFTASLHDKLQAGLHAVAKHFQGNPEAMALYEQARSLITRETQAAAPANVEATPALPAKVQPAALPTASAPGSVNQPHARQNN